MLATFKHGCPLMINYSAGAATGGTPVVVGNLVLIPHRDIASGETGALAAGEGVYLVTGDAAITAGKLLYWNAAAGKVTETAGSNKKFGYSAEACSGDGAKFLAIHRPG